MFSVKAFEDLRYNNFIKLLKTTMLMKLKAITPKISFLLVMFKKSKKLLNKPLNK